MLTIYLLVCVEIRGFWGLDSWGGLGWWEEVNRVGSSGLRLSANQS